MFAVCTVICTVPCGMPCLKHVVLQETCYVQAWIARVITAIIAIGNDRPAAVQFDTLLNTHVQHVTWWQVQLTHKLRY